MADPVLPIVAAVWALLSALGIVGLGLLTLRGGAARPRGALAFGVFSLLWGMQIMAGAAMRLVPDGDVARVLYLVFTALLLPLPFFLIEFSAAQSYAGGAGAWRATRATAASVGIAGALALVFAPQLVVARVLDASGALAPVEGPLYPLLLTLPLFAAFGIALLSLWRAFRAAPTPRVAQQSALVLAGLGLYVAFTAANNLVFFGATPILYPSFFEASDALFIGVFGGLTLVCALVIARARGALRAARGDAERRLARLVMLTLAVPLVVGAAEGALDILFGPIPATSTGLWRLAGVAVIAYGLARWRVYDLPQRAGNAAATAGGAALAGATGVAAYGAGAVASSSPAVPLAAGALMVALALVPSIRFARRWARQSLPEGGMDQALYGQRIDTYRAALEAAIARGSLEEDSTFLDALRERFGITEAEDRVLRYYAQSSVIVSRKADAWEVYDRLRLLGEGGGGRTWLARDRARDRLVVLKEPLERWQQDPAAREAVLREARLAAKVRHRNVVAVEEVIENGKSPVIVMEHLEGGSLADLLRARGSLPWRDAVVVMQDVLAGLEAVHANGIVHRDVKPSNVLLTHDGAAKIADFGIAVAGDAVRSQKTQIMDATTTATVGTAAYMAPEVRAGASSGTRASDVYACGILLHELLHGAPPGIQSPAVLVRNVPDALTAIVARAIDERPDARPPTARAFAEQLARLADEL